jgi:hypothetical protein
MSNQSIGMEMAPPAVVAPEKARLAIRRLAMIALLAVVLGFATKCEIASNDGPLSGPPKHLILLANR